jgi:hypothetical protein
MGAVKVTPASKAFLAQLVASGRAANLSDAVTYLCERVKELEAMQQEPRVGSALGGKRERVSLGNDERVRLEAVSEPTLGTLWDGMTEMKQAIPSARTTEDLHKALASDLFPCEWGSLLLQVPELPSRGQISRLDAANFLVDGWKATIAIWLEKCVGELGVLNNLFGNWSSSDESAETLAERFETQCPTLERLFCGLVLEGSRVDENVQKTAEFKRMSFVFLVAAIGKVRSKHNAECGRFLYRLWRSLGAPTALVDCLASLGLSISAKRGKEEEVKLITAAENQIQYHTRKRGSSKIFFASCDNVDESFKSRLQQIGSRDLSLHFINSTLYRFRLPVPAALDRVGLREDVLDMSVLFATKEMNYSLAALCVDNLGRVLQPLLGGFLFQGCGLVFKKKVSAPNLVSLGVLEKTKTYPLPTQNSSESIMSEFFTYEKDFLARFPEGEKVLVAADAKTYLSMKKSQKLYKMERCELSDCDDSKAIPVPDWFHLSVCVFLGDCTRNNFALLQQFCSLIGGSYVINASVGKCMNDTMRVFNAFYPVAVARLFQYYLTYVAASVGIVLPETEYEVVVRNFWMWIVFTARTMNANVDPVREYQRHCRLVLVLAVYNVTWESARCANHDALIDILHWILPIVCQGPFSQYRYVVIDSLAYYHRASAADQFLYKQSFTVNHTGKALDNFLLCGTPLMYISTFSVTPDPESLLPTSRDVDEQPIKLFNKVLFPVPTAPYNTTTFGFANSSISKVLLSFSLISL